jgi:hypothetical protein
MRNRQAVFIRMKRTIYKNIAAAPPSAPLWTRSRVLPRKSAFLSASCRSFFILIFSFFFLRVLRALRGKFLRLFFAAKNRDKIL